MDLWNKLLQLNIRVVNRIKQEDTNRIRNAVSELSADFHQEAVS